MADIFEYDTRKKSIGERIKTLRKDHKYTQTELAGKLSQIIPNDKEHPIGQSTIASWEKGVTLPPLNRLIALSIIFDCDVSYLLCDYDIQNQNVEYIKKTTGLSEGVVSRLHQELLSNDTTWNIGRLNSLLSSNIFWEIIGILQTLQENSAYLRAYHAFDSWGISDAADSINQKIDVRDLLRYRAQRLFDRIMDSIESEKITPTFKIEKVDTSNLGEEENNG